MGPNEFRQKVIEAFHSAVNRADEIDLIDKSECDMENIDKAIDEGKLDDFIYEIIRSAFNRGYEH